MYLGLTTAQSAAQRAAQIRPVFESEQPMPADGVLYTGDINVDFANLQAGKTVYRRLVKNAGPGGQPKYAAVTAPDPAHRGRVRVVGRAPVLISYLVDVYGASYKYPFPAPDLAEFQRRLTELANSDTNLFSRSNLLRATRVAAVVAAAYFAAPYIASAVSSSGAASGAASAAEGAAASGSAATAAAAGEAAASAVIPGASLLETGAGAALADQLKQKAEQKLISLVMPKRSAPGVITPPQAAPVSQPMQEAAPAPSAAKPLLLTIAGALPFLLLL